MARRCLCGLCAARVSKEVYPGWLHVMNRGRLLQPPGVSVAALLVFGLALIAGCGESATGNAPAAASQPPARVAARVPNFDWPLLGLNPQRTDATSQATG